MRCITPPARSPWRRSTPWRTVRSVAVPCLTAAPAAPPRTRPLDGCKAHLLALPWAALAVMVLSAIALMRAWGASTRHRLCSRRCSRRSLRLPHHGPAVAVEGMDLFRRSDCHILVGATAQRLPWEQLQAWTSQRRERSRRNHSGQAQAEALPSALPAAAGTLTTVNYRGRSKPLLLWQREHQTTLARLYWVTSSATPSKHPSRRTRLLQGAGGSRAAHPMVTRAVVSHRAAASTSTKEAQKAMGAAGAAEEWAHCGR